MYEGLFRTSGTLPVDTGQVRILRSWGQGQGHRSKKGKKIPDPVM